MKETRLQVVLVGLSYRTAPVNILEQLTVPPIGYPEVLKELLEFTGLPEAVLLFTISWMAGYGAEQVR